MNSGVLTEGDEVCFFSHSPACVLNYIVCIHGLLNLAYQISEIVNADSMFMARAVESGLLTLLKLYCFCRNFSTSILVLRIVCAVVGW
jgi:hypothetical protein